MEELSQLCDKGYMREKGVIEAEAQNRTTRRMISRNVDPALAGNDNVKEEEDLPT